MFTITRTGTKNNVTVPFNFSGVAGHGTDYNLVSGYVTFTGMETSKTVTIWPMDDSLYEPTEDVILTLVTNADLYTFGTQNTATVAIVDADNHAPTANADAFTTDEDHHIDITFAQLLGNDVPGPASESGQTLEFVSATSGAGGNVFVHTGFVRFVPNPNGFGTGTFTYSIKDNGTTNGQADPKSATGTVTVTINSVNDLPDFLLSGNRENNEGDSVSVAVADLLYAASDVESGTNLTYSVTGLPTGLSVNAVHQIVGTVSYDAWTSTNQGAFVTTVTATDGDGGSTSKSFTWTVTNVDIGSLIVTEVYSSNHAVIGHAEVYQDYYAHVFYVGVSYWGEPNHVRLAVAAPDIGVLPPANRIRFYVTPGAASPNSGDFTSTPEITPVPSQDTHVYVAIDRSGNGDLEASEIAMGFHVIVRSLSPAGLAAGMLKSQRVAGGPGPGSPEASLFLVNAGEHFEVGGRFQFALANASIDPGPVGSVLGFQVYKSTFGIDSRLYEGAAPGGVFEVTLTSADVGDVYVRYFIDINGNGQFDDAFESRTSDTAFNQFEVKELRTEAISVAVSDRIGGFTSNPPLSQAQLQAQIDPVFKTSFDKSLNKDSDDDFRAAIWITAGTITVVNIAALTGVADPVPYNDADRMTIHNANLAYVVFVSDLGAAPNSPNGLRGEALLNSPHILIDWNEQWEETLVHEYGHTRGLDHPDANGDNDNIMRDGGNRNRGAAKLNEPEVDAYE